MCSNDKELRFKSWHGPNPATPLSTINSILPELDLVLLMSVNPGFGGQKFIDSTIPKIKKLRKKIDSLDKEIRLEVDGGISKENISEVSKSGADTFVAGSAFLIQKLQRNNFKFKIFN